MKVVVVDDSLEVQKSLGRLLASVAGIDVAGYARDVSGALSLIDSIQPDVIVLDVNLLDGDNGIDVLRYAKRQRPRIKVIGLSNLVSERVRAGFLEAGASAFFDKSTEFMLARDWIAGLLAQSPPMTPAPRD